MIAHISNFQDPRTRKIVFLLSIIVCLFWITGSLINVYRFAFVGAVYEILWIGIVALTLMIPIISLIIWIKEGFSLKSLYLVSFIIIVATVVLLQVYVG